MSRGVKCRVHTHFSNVPQENHHIWPKGYHGPSTPDNLVLVCANAHGDIHYFLDYLLKNNGKPPVDYRTYNMKSRVLATRGYMAVILYAASIVPTTTPPEVPVP